MERKDKSLDDVFKIIEDGVIDVYSSENYLNYLKTLSKFHSYSFSNTMLIYAQKNDATLVAGYEAWKHKFNRQVRRGEKSIKILAPYKRKVWEEKISRDKHGLPVKDEKDNIVVEKVLVEKIFFKMVSVFDISQTEGEPLPQLVHELTGSSDNAKALINAINEISETPIYYRTAEEDDNLKTGAKGYFNPVDNSIVIKEGMEEHQQVKTLLHEYCHSLLHNKVDDVYKYAEIEAESLAFVVCDHFGIDTSAYSFNYIATYAEENPTYLRSILTNIKDKAHDIIDEIAPVFDRHIQKIRNEVEINLDDSSLADTKDFNIFQQEYIAESLIASMYDSIYGTGLHDYLRSSDCNETEGMEMLKTELDATVEQYAKKYPLATALYNKKGVFHDCVIETVFCKSYYHMFDPVNDRPFLEHSQERKNYTDVWYKLAPLFDSAVDEIVLLHSNTSSLIFKRETDATYSVTAYSMQDGKVDKMVMTFSFDFENKLITAVDHERNEFGSLENCYSDYSKEQANQIVLSTLCTKAGMSSYRIHEFTGKDIHITLSENERTINTGKLNSTEKKFAKTYLSFLKKSKQR